MFLVELIASSFLDLISKQARPAWRCKRVLVLLQITASHTSVQYNTHLPLTLHSKLFLQVLRMLLYC